MVLQCPSMDRCLAVIALSHEYVRMYNAEYYAEAEA
jgi:hypothetical protein